MCFLNFALTIALLCAVRAAQIPIQTLATGTVGVDSAWSDLSALPGANATGQLIFDTVNSLLQHWPNTRYRNGHNIIPGSVPVGTLLYHGRANNSLPTVPEWTATDPEHAYGFCGGAPGNDTNIGCWQLTFVVARPLKVLYFDGSSAANMKAGAGGTQDVQDLLVWGEVDHARWIDERGRINGLCEWGREFGIEGYVRMEMDFEIMICDFTVGVELLAADFLAAWWAHFITPPLWDPASQSADPGSTRPRPRPHPRNNSEPPAAALLRFETIRAGSWHNRYPGETRVVLDLSRLVSFYDTALVPSLIPHRAGLERWDHRAQNISAADLAAVTERLRALLASTSESSSAGSGVDWKTMYRVVVDRYAERLELLQYLLNTTTTETAAARGKTIQGQLRVMLTPYTLHAARPVVGGPAGDGWAAPVWRGCATRHTAHIHASAALSARLTASERLLLSALDETGREICRVVVRMWAAGVRAELDSVIPVAANAEDIPHVVEGWRADANALMQWLDWSVWVKCRPACGVEEMCYLPTWPYFGQWTGEREKGDDTEKAPPWKRPQPRCIRLFEPYSPL
ncbi:hypothetical protein B0H17DRAFT_1200141 [Mycena rosella]|uniref:Uncharacterized protein n=1 Tax=Mycena rosella TaxID=1033263 RepID=A0AAD7GJ11_MYCRO|nr:hypothetical protein B0H17DRAFT_1200141 [Mycena rosella]